MCNAGLLHNRMKPRRVDFILPFYSIQILMFTVSFFTSSIASFPSPIKNKAPYLPFLFKPNGMG